MLCVSDVSECMSAPCMYNATCQDHVNGYKCTCTDGYTGGHCETGRSIFVSVFQSTYIAWQYVAICTT